jgi:hypothetical protein
MTLQALEPQAIVILSTVAAEAGDSSSGSWSMVTNTILNRFALGNNPASKHGDWKGMSLIDICKKGFDGARMQTPEYRRACEYYSNRISSSPDPKLEEIILICHPIILSTVPDNTGGCVLYYSPKLQAALHLKNANQYAAAPHWDFTVLEEVFPPGLDGSDFKCYRYKTP